MTAARPLGFWLAALAVLVAAVWLLRAMLLPFVVAMAIAYLLDPVTDRLERAGAPRWLAATAMLLFFVAFSGISNFGILARQRSVIEPLLLVFLTLPPNWDEVPRPKAPQARSNERFVRPPNLR